MRNGKASLPSTLEQIIGSDLSEDEKKREVLAMIRGSIIDGCYVSLLRQDTTDSESFSPDIRESPSGEKIWTWLTFDSSNGQYLLPGNYQCTWLQIWDAVWMADDLDVDTISLKSTTGGVEIPVVLAVAAINEWFRPS